MHNELAYLLLTEDSRPDSAIRSVPQLLHQVHSIGLVSCSAQQQQYRRSFVT